MKTTFAAYITTVAAVEESKDAHTVTVDHGIKDTKGRSIGGIASIVLDDGRCYNGRHAGEYEVRIDPTRDGKRFGASHYGRFYKTFDAAFGGAKAALMRQHAAYARKFPSSTQSTTNSSTEENTMTTTNFAAIANAFSPAAIEKKATAAKKPTTTKKGNTMKTAKTAAKKPAAKTTKLSRITEYRAARRAAHAGATKAEVEAIVKPLAKRVDDLHALAVAIWRLAHPKAA